MITRVMSKKAFLLIATAAVLVIGGVAGYFVLSSRSKSAGSDGGQRGLSFLPKTEKKEEINADTLYEDTAGFSFKYPKDVKVTDVTPDEDEYYTQLNLSRGSEKIVLTAKDASAKTADDWLKGDSTYSGSSLVGATTLAGISAKQYSKGETLITIAVDAGVVYLIEGPKDEAFWEDVHGALISSFKFSGTASAGQASSGSSDIEYEEEEVVE